MGEDERRIAAAMGAAGFLPVTNDASRASIPPSSKPAPPSQERSWPTSTTVRRDSWPNAAAASGLVLSLLAVLLLAYAFTATSSDLALVTRGDLTMLCRNGVPLFGGNEGSVIADDPGFDCTSGAKRLAIVTRENNDALWVGFGLLIAGTLFQLAALKK